jgi:hypothetical protein
MTGHDAILSMRREGRKPAYVWITDHEQVAPHFLTVRIQPADVPEQMDLRFLIGLTALIEGSDPVRAERLATVCRQVAKRVITTVSHGRTVDSITDTEGTMQWPN